MLYTPCSETEVYIALTMLDSDEAAKEIPVDRDAWKRWFPHLEALIGRIRAAGRYDRFEYIKLKRWSAGKVAVIGDAAHALPPNIGQGGGCAMMNALSLAVYLDREHDTPAALATWESNERAITEHTQRISLMLGWPTTWPPYHPRQDLGARGKIEMAGPPAHQDGAASCRRGRRALLRVALIVRSIAKRCGSKDGARSMLAAHPSRRALRAAPQDEVENASVKTAA